MWAEPVEGGTFDVEDSVRASIGFAQGMQVQLEIAWATHLPEGSWKDGLIVYGDRGMLIVDLWSDAISLCEAVDGKPHESIISVEVDDAWADAFQGEHRAFAAAMESRTLQDGAGSGEDGRLVQAVVEAIYTSNEAQKEVAIVI